MHLEMPQIVYGHVLTYHIAFPVDLDQLPKYV